ATALQKLGADRDAVADQMRMMLWQAEFGDQAIDENDAKSLIGQANDLLDRAKNLFPASEVSPSAGNQLRKINHIVVIYEENHSFDNLYGGWEGVNGLSSPDAAARSTQVDQNGVPYSCLLQNDVNLASPPLPATCNDAAHGFSSAFTNTWFTIDPLLPPSATTCPTILGAFAFPFGVPNGTGQPGGCTRDLVHKFYQEQY